MLAAAAGLGRAAAPSQKGGRPPSTPRPNVGAPHPSPHQPTPHPPTPFQPQPQTPPPGRGPGQAERAGAGKARPGRGQRIGAHAHVHHRGAEAQAQGPDGGVQRAAHAGGRGARHARARALWVGARPGGGLCVRACLRASRAERRWGGSPEGCGDRRSAADGRLALCARPRVLPTRRTAHPPYCPPAVPPCRTAQQIQDEYREVVERRVYTVTGQHMPEEDIERLIETGALGSVPFSPLGLAPCDGVLIPAASAGPFPGLRPASLWRRHV